ncbi:hypothetical protein QTH87_10145 [Variovorax sp. J22P168]|uniref:hypothetical protein n=1 Tax=Variovorax jilinensis TaxID=3053513 RepID=UPI00257782CF|nr:hypothetical protein [Variovorax sp. J22P168]MDM0012790.1 hypothetical protein [Variovorax sp. J22P168]
MLTAQAYTPHQLAEALDAPVSWLEPVPAYLEALAGSFEWLGDWLAHRAPPRMLTIVIGDHQPMASVSGPGASWEVPVHIVSNDAALLRRFAAAGFAPGMAPMQPATLPMHAPTPLLLAAFDAAPENGSRAPPDARSRP